MFSESFFYLILIGIQLALCFQDIKSQMVSIWIVLGFFLLCLFFGFFITKSFSLIPIVIFAIIGVVYYLIQKEQAFGIADYIVVFAISFLIPVDLWPFFFVLTGAFGVLISIFYEKKRFPFIPAILASTDILMVFS